MKKNDHLELFRAKVGILLTQYAERLKIYVAENKLMGLDAKALKEQRGRPLSRWAMNKEQLNRAIKREVAGLINKLFLTAYLQEIKRAR